MAVFNDGIAGTEAPEGSVVEARVLIVGSGPAGSATALFLSEIGVPNPAALLAAATTLVGRA